MRSIPSFFLGFRPPIVREFVMKRSQIAAIGVNALNGAFLITAVSMTMLPLFSVLLVALLGILFGPLVGFTVSSIYSRIEKAVGRKLGGSATLDSLYRIFAWSFLPLGFACLLFRFILLAFNEPKPIITFAASIPSLVFVLWSIWNYSSNIIAVQQFTRARGVISLILTLFLFLVVIAGGIGFFSLLIKSGKGEFILKEIFFWL
jgi:hypothetical protein